MCHSRFTLAVLLLLLAVAISCQRRDDSPAQNDQATMDARPVSSPTTHPAYWIRERDQWEQLTAKMRQIRTGQSKSEVLATLGKPDSDRVAAPKGFGVKPHGTVVEYNFVKYEQGFVNTKWDQFVMFEFDMDGNLRYVYSNVEDVSTIGEMIRRER